ncbi:hypothetical protein VM98_36355, partial [Streptomyces rubellomurinus subsp. indigoferus]
GDGAGDEVGEPIGEEEVVGTKGGEGVGDEPLWRRKVESKMGDSSGAGGVGGVMKIGMAMRNGGWPRTLRVDEPWPHVDWDSGRVELLTEARDWPAGERPRRAGVSSFGVSGTN